VERKRLAGFPPRVNETTLHAAGQRIIRGDPDEHGARGLQLGRKLFRRSAPIIKAPMVSRPCPGENRLDYYEIVGL